VSNQPANSTTYFGAAVTNFDAYDSYDNWDECLTSNSNASGVEGTRDATYGQGANVSLGMLLRASSGGVVIGALHTEGGSQQSNPSSTSFIVRKRRGLL